jgi:protein-disulfide isomerase
MAYFGLIGLLFSFNKPLADKIVFITTTLGAGVSIILCWIQFKAELNCPLCLGVHFINLLMLIGLLTIIIPVSLNNSQKQIIKRNVLIRWSSFLIIGIIVGGISEYGILRYSFGQKNKVKLTELQKSFESEKVYPIPVNSTSPLVGSLKAPVQVVVFSSFECPACKLFATTLKELHNKFGEKIGISFKNFPLSNTCNPRLADNMQPNSCNAALAAIAAQNQNRFWEYHDQLFNSDLHEGSTVLNSIATTIGLDKSKWEADMHSETVKEKLTTDIILANQLGINATPTIYINGKKVSSFQESALSFLIENELKKH